MPRFKSSKRGLHSIEGKTNKTGLKFRPEKKVLNWCGHDYRVLVDPKDDYIQRALKENERSDKYRKIKYCGWCVNASARQTASSCRSCLKGRLLSSMFMLL